MRIFLLVMAVIGAAMLGAHLVFSPPPIDGRTASEAVEASTATRLGRIALTPPEVRRGDSGVLPLIDGPDAFAARIALIRAAEQALDVQYYIWHRDATGLILLEELRRAAERGVRVRLLLDDNGIPGLDRLFATLNAQDNFEIRLFNPSTVRRPKYLGYAIDFFRMNRRMHNKSMIVDGTATIIGGRNIGDEYFQIGNAFYLDMDAVAVGHVVPETSAVFDAYWNAASAVELERVIPGAGDIAAFEARVAALRSAARAGGAP